MIAALNRQQRHLLCVGDGTLTVADVVHKRQMYFSTPA